MKYLCVIVLLSLIVGGVFAGGQADETTDPESSQLDSPLNGEIGDEANVGNDTRQSPSSTEFDIDDNYVIDETEETGEELATYTIPAWLLQHYSPIASVAVEQMKPIIEQSMLPVGLHVVHGKNISVLYALNTAQVPIRALVIHQFKDFNTLNEEMTQFIQDGFLPMDISHSSNELYVLLLQVPIVVEAWTISIVPYNLGTINQEMKEIRENDFIPWGISVNSDEAWIISLQVSDQDSYNVLAQIYRNDISVYGDGIKTHVARGLYPWGISVVDHREILVLYRRDI